MLATYAAALPFAFCRKEIMELSREFDKVDVLPMNHYEISIHAYSTWIEYCNEKMMDPTASDYDMIGIKYAMLFAEKEHK